MAKDYYNGNACYEAMKSVLTAEELRGFCIGNAFKYIWRHHRKGSSEDLEKACDYLQRALELDDRSGETSSDVLTVNGISWAQAITESEMEDEDG